MDLAPTVASRATYETGKTFEALEAALHVLLKPFDTETAASLVRRQAPWDEVKAVVSGLSGNLGLMIIGRAGQGAVTSLSGHRKRSALYLIGNPVIANEILEIDLRAALYVPLRVALHAPDDGPTGLISYELPSSLFASLDRDELKPYGELLDDKLAGLVKALRGPVE